MALTVIKPSGIETSGNYTVNGMNVSANASVANLTVTTSLNLLTNSANLGPVGNVIITGGTNGYVLQTDGAGNLSWQAPTSGSSIANGNSNVSIPTANGNINFTAVGNTVMVITGTGANISGTLNATGNATVGNLDFGSGVITGTGNITAGNANLGNLVTANFFTGNGSQLSSLTFGNITTFSTAGLTTDELYLQATTRLNVTASGASGYLFDQYGATLNPAIYVNSGQTLAFNLNVSGHPFLIQTSGSANYSTGLEYVDATGTVLTAASAQGQVSGTLYWKVPYGITGNYKYICSIHGGMNGNIVVTDANVANIQVGNALISGTVYTNAQPNITSVGTLTDVSVSGNGVFGGNLTVNGTLTYINSTTLSISDPIINLQTGPNGAAPVANTGKDVGTALNYFDTSAKIAWMGWDVSNAEIAFGSNVGISSEVVTFTSLANIRSGNAQLGNNVTANFFTGNGSFLTGITTTSIANGNSNVNIPSANGNINLTAVGNTTMVITGTGANISGTANVTGNLVAGNITAGSGSGGNITGGNVVSANTFIALTSANFVSASNVNLGAVGNVKITGGTINQYLQTDGTGNLSWSTVVSGSSSNISNGNSNVNIPSANGNINFSAVGNANVVVITGTGANISGTANVTGNLTAGNITAGAGTGGSITGGNLVSANYLTGTLTTAAQPNITSVGSLTGLTVSNATGVVNFTTTANVTLGAVANLHIAGGSNTQYLQTDGTGNLTWASISSGSGISNGTSNISIPVTNGNINLTAGGNTSLVVTDLGANISGNMQSTGNITAQYFVGNGFYLTGVDTSPANIANGTSNVEVALSGNVTTSVAGNANILTVTGTGIVVSGNATIGVGTGGNLSGVNVVSATTVTTSGNISASGNSSAQYFVGNGFYLTGVDTSPANISNGISNVQVYLDSNITMSVAGNANILTVTGTGINVSGNATIGVGTGGNLSGVNVVSATTVTTSGNISASGNSSAQYFVGNGFYLTGVDTSPANITNGTSNVEVALSGNVTTSVAGNANILTVTGTGINVFGNATIGSGTGGNISGANNMSANTFTALSSVNFVSASNVSLGAVGNVKITGGTSSYVLSTDGTGNLSWIAPGSGSSGISNGNSNVNIPSANGNINFTAVGNTVMVITGTGANIAGTLNATGNITAGNANLGNAATANFFIGNGNNLSNISGANVTGQVSNALVAGTVTTAAQPNITSVGTLTDLSVSGNGVFGGNLTVNGTLTYINSTTLSISDPIINLQTGPNGAAPVANSGKDVGTALNYYDTSAKIAWMGWDVSNAEIAFGSNVGIASEVVTFTSLANIRSGNASLGNAATANFFIGSGNNLSNISGSNVSGTVANATYAISAGTAGTVTTNAQPNITSVGNLSGLTVSNATGVVDFTTTANVTLGAVANLHISGGTNGYVLSTDGSGALSWVAQSGGGGGASISNGNSNVNIPTANGNINFTAVGNTTMIITGTGANIAGTLNVTGQSNLGNVGNVKIIGGTANYVLKTDGNGNLDWVAQSAANVTVDNFTGNGVQTVFTLSTTPIGINQTSVNYNGATVLRTDYTLANANITFSSAPANGSYIEVTTINLTAGGGGGTSAAAAVGYSLIFGG